MNQSGDPKKTLFSFQFSISKHEATGYPQEKWKGQSTKMAIEKVNHSFREKYQRVARQKSGFSVEGENLEQRRASTATPRPSQNHQIEIFGPSDPRPARDRTLLQPTTVLHHQCIEIGGAHLQIIPNFAPRKKGNQKFGSQMVELEEDILCRKHLKRTFKAENLMKSQKSNRATAK